MALILITLFLLFAVVFRATLQRINTGDFGIRTASLNASLTEILPGTFFILSFISATVLIIIAMLGQVAPATNFPNSIDWLFFVIGLVGLLVTIIAQNQMGNSWRIGVDQTEITTLKTAGLYTYSRNPIYFGLFLFWIGLSGTFPHPLLWFFAIICWCCIEIIVRKIEEPYLRNLHGKQFDIYFKKTNRYIPVSPITSKQ